jgi:hypothetical protein
MPNVLMISVIMPSVAMLSVIMPNVLMMNVIMPSFVMLILKAEYLMSSATMPMEEDQP